MTAFPELTELPPEEVPFQITFTQTEQKGQIWNFDVSENYQTATETGGGYAVNVYDDVQYVYSICPGYTHQSPCVYWQGETLYIILKKFVIEVPAYEEYHVYQYTNLEAGEAFHNQFPVIREELDIGNRHYFMEKGNLLFTENGSAGSFYVADERTNGLGQVILLWVIAIPLGIWMYRTFMKRLHYQEGEDTDEI